MVNNHPKARPQSGLIKRIIVYEILAEGEVTRFLGDFQSEKPENIGPVEVQGSIILNWLKRMIAFLLLMATAQRQRKCLIAATSII